MTYQEPPLENEIELIALARKLKYIVQIVRQHKKLIAIRTGIAGVIGLVIALGSPVEYSTSMRLLPYRDTGSGGSGLSGLAGLAGIRFPVRSTDQAIPADLYPEIAKSLDFKIAVAETELTFESLQQKASLVEYFTSIHSPSLTQQVSSYTIGLPGKILSALRTEPTKQGAEKESSTVTIRSFPSSYLATVATVDERLTISIDKKTSIVNIAATMPDKYAAADLVQAASTILIKNITEFESRKASEQFRFINDQHQKSKVRFEKAQRDLASFADKNRTLMGATAQIERERLQREYDLTFEIYQQLSRDLEQSRIKMSQDTPVFTVLEQVTIPATKASPARGRIFAGALLLGLIVGMAELGIRKIKESI